jgi:ABC-type phosphate transport system substrate-binding protein
MKKGQSLTRWIGLFACLAVVMILSGTTGPLAAGNVTVVANKAFPTAGITKADLKDVALGDKTAVGGAAVTFVTLESGEAHEDFLKAFVEKSGLQFANYWKQMIFTGKGKPPKAFKSEAELIGFVAATKGAIGYVSAGADTSAVKVLAVQ